MFLQIAATALKNSKFHLVWYIDWIHLHTQNILNILTIISLEPLIDMTVLFYFYLF